MHENIINLDFILDGYIPIHLFSFFNVNGNLYLDKVRNKVINKIPLDYVDVAFLKFATLTCSDLKIHEMLMEIVKLTMGDESLDDELKLKIQIIQLRICLLYVDKKHQKPILEVLSMKSSLVEDYKIEITENVTKSVTEEVTKSVTDEVTGNFENKLIKALHSADISDCKIDEILDLTFK